MKKLIYIIIFLLLFPLAVSAQYQPPISTPSYYFFVDKKIAYPVSENNKITYYYVDNLSADTYYFRPDQYIFFQITVKNGSNNTLTGVEIEDRVTSDIILFPDGNQSISDQRIKITVGTLSPGEAKNYIVRARVKSAPELNFYENEYHCQTNTAIAYSGIGTDSDDVNFCIQGGISVSASPTSPPGVISAPTISPAIPEIFPKSGILPPEKKVVVPPKQIPATGPEHLSLLTIFSLLTAFLGWKIKKMTVQ